MEIKADDPIFGDEIPEDLGKSCMFHGREGICCDRYDLCDRCGFNPRVEARRIRRLRERYGNTPPPTEKMVWKTGFAWKEEDED